MTAHPSMPGSRPRRCARPAATCARSPPGSPRCSSSRTIGETRLSNRAAGEAARSGVRDARRRSPRRFPMALAAGTVSGRRRDHVTQTAPTATDVTADDRLLEVALPAAGPNGPVPGVALVTIRRPDVLNALSFDLLDQLADTFDALDVDPAFRAIVLTGP